VICIQNDLTPEQDGRLALWASAHPILARFLLRFGTPIVGMDIDCRAIVSKDQRA
jgi:hypothetical protein